MKTTRLSLSCEGMKIGDERYEIQHEIDIVVNIFTSSLRRILMIDNSAIDKWLDERQQLLVQYCELAGLPPYTREEEALPDKQTIASFCQILVDYVSVGHFEVYEQVSDNMSSEQDQIRIKEALPKISSSTDLALKFNDSFADASEDNDFSRFDYSLSDLGQHLEARFALEDELINMIQPKRQAQ